MMSSILCPERLVPEESQESGEPVFQRSMTFARQVITSLLKAVSKVTIKRVVLMFPEQNKKKKKKKGKNAKTSFSSESLQNAFIHSFSEF